VATDGVRAMNARWTGWTPLPISRILTANAGGPPQVRLMIRLFPAFAKSDDIKPPGAT
jgi:hypothetical protein